MKEITIMMKRIYQHKPISIQAFQWGMGEQPEWFKKAMDIGDRCIVPLQDGHVLLEDGRTQINLQVGDYMTGDAFSHLRVYTATAFERKFQLCDELMEG
jgi:hypothetical protein